jgi:hypothetical protein
MLQVFDNVEPLRFFSIDQFACHVLDQIAWDRFALVILKRCISS